MTQPDDMARHVVGGLVFVDENRPVRTAGATGADRDGDTAGIGNQVQHALIVAQGRRQDEAGDPSFDLLAHQFDEIGRVFAALHFQVDVAPARFLQRAHQKFAEVGGGRIVEHQADADLVAAGQAAGGPVGRVIQLGDRGLHLVARFRPDVTFAIDDAADRHGGTLRFARDVGDGGRIAASAGRTRLAGRSAGRIGCGHDLSISWPGAKRQVVAHCPGASGKARDSYHSSGWAGGLAPGGSGRPFTDCQ